MATVRSPAVQPPLSSAVVELGGDGWHGAAPAAGRTMGRRGGPLTPPWTPPWTPPPLPLYLAVLLLGWSVGVGVSAARLPAHYGGRLGPGPSVEEDNPLPHHTVGHQGGGASSAQQRRCAALSTRVLRQVLGPAYNPAYMAFSLDNPRGGGGGGGFGPFQSDVRDTRGAGEGLDAQQYSGGESLSPFSVDEDYSMVLGDEPAWQTQYDMPSVMLSGGADVGGGGAYHSYRTSAGRRAREAPAEEGAAEDTTVTKADAEDASAARAGRAAWSMPMGAGRDMQWHCESPLRWVDLGPDYFPRYLRSADCGHHTCTGAGFVCRPRSFSVKVLRRREGVCAPASDLPREESTVGLPHDLRDMWVWELRAVNFCCVCSMHR